jgi:methylenetetrahydrofolate reductase (NADPH)
MRVSDIIAETKSPSFSFEIIPPPRGRSIMDVIEIVEFLMPLKPRWFDVTSHSSSAYIHEDSDGTLRRKTYKKRPGSLGICGVIQNRFKVDTVAHLLCLGFNREETEDALIELHYLGLENVLLLRGDSPNFEKRFAKEKSLNFYASDLVKQVINMRAGKFMDELSNSTGIDFCIGVAGYPEKHFEAANLEIDILNLKAKVDAGADYVVTQMFFDNKRFFEFEKQCRAAGIKVPIVPGLKVLKSTHQLKSVPRTFHVDLPNELAREAIENPDHVDEIGLRWAEKQVKELINHGHNNIHFYVMNDMQLVKNVIETVD